MSNFYKDLEIAMNGYSTKPNPVVSMQVRSIIREAFHAGAAWAIKEYAHRVKELEEYQNKDKETSDKRST